MSLIENNTDSAADSLLWLRGEHFSLFKPFPFASFPPLWERDYSNRYLATFFDTKLPYFSFSCATLTVTLGNRMRLNDEMAPPG